jgi:hypothetical protein
VAKRGSARDFCIVIIGSRIAIGRVAYHGNVGRMLRA